MKENYNTQKNSLGRVQYEEKFVVFNRKHLAALPRELRRQFEQVCRLMQPWLPQNKYYVCNQDEPYASKVFQIILQGENEKIRAKEKGVRDD